MNTVEEFRASLHNAVDDEPSSTVDSVAIASGALRSHRRRMALSTAGVAGLAVVALAASAQTAATVGTAHPAAAPTRQLGAGTLPEIKFAAEPLSWSLSHPAKFKTERGDSVELALTRATSSSGAPTTVRNIGFTISDGANPPHVSSTSSEGLRPGEFLENPTHPPTVATDPPVDGTVIVRTSHGTLVLCVVSSDITSALIAPAPAGFGARSSLSKNLVWAGPLPGKRLTGEKKSVVFWSYLPDDKHATSALVATGSPTRHFLNGSVPAGKEVLLVPAIMLVTPDGKGDAVVGFAITDGPSPSSSAGPKNTP
jgi:hypothetical protein